MSEQFFSNPILNFAGIVASVLGFVIGIPLAIYLYRRGTKRRGLTYKVRPVRTQIVKAGAVSRLSVVHEGREIKSDITAAHIAIWNQGRESIRQADMLRPLVIETDNHAPILEATIQRVTHDVIELRLDESKCDQGRLDVSWNILEERDGGIMQIIYAGSSDLPITAHAIVEGQRNIIDCSHVIPLPPTAKMAEKAERTLYRFVLLVAAITVLQLFSELAPFFLPFMGQPPSIWALGAICLATICMTVFVVCMLSMLRLVKPPFEF